MEPVWLGIGGARAASTVNKVARKVTQPFTAALEHAQELMTPRAESASPDRALVANDPHTKLLAEVLTGNPLVGDQSIISLPDIRQQAETLQSELATSIEAALRNAGIDFEGELGLRISPLDGSLEVVGDVPQAGEIEHVLGKDPKLAQEFRRLSALASLVAAADAHSEFADAYEQNPYSAVEQYSELFVEEPNATLLLGTFSSTIRFEE